ncbi:MAG: elongation factor P [Anaerolineales bacterium]
MVSVTELRKGVTFEHKGELWRVLEYDHHKPGRGGAIIRTKLRNLRTGTTVNETFLSGESVDRVYLEHRTVRFLYEDGDFYHFMDEETYEQPALPKEALEDVAPYLKEGITLDLEMYEGEPMGIDLPLKVNLEVVEAPPGFAGDTAGSATKVVTVETGLRVEVPLFVEKGDVIRVDTRTGEYLTRV